MIQRYILFVVMMSLLTSCTWNKTTKFDSYGTGLQKPLIISQLKIVTAKGKPRQGLLHLLDLCGIKHDATLADIIEKTQHEWLRKPGTERWQNDDVPEKIARETAIPCFEQLGILKEVTVTYSTYDYAFLLGAAAERVRVRLSFLVALWMWGIRFKQVVLLGSERPLSSVADSVPSLLNVPQVGLPTRKDWIAPSKLPQTEAEMMRMIYDQVEMPHGMRKLPLVVINSSQIKTADGSFRRATTADTIIDWLKTNPKPGRCLFVSNQPYVGYQYTVARVLMPKTFVIDTVGAAVENREMIKVNIYLDTIARWLFQEVNKKALCFYGQKFKVSEGCNGVHLPA